MNGSPRLESRWMTFAGPICSFCHNVATPPVHRFEGGWVCNKTQMCWQAYWARVKKKNVHRSIE